MKIDKAYFMKKTMNQTERRAWDIYSLTLWALFVVSILQNENNPAKYMWMTCPVGCWFVLAFDFDNSNVITSILFSLYVAACAASFVVFVIKGE